MNIAEIIAALGGLFQKPGTPASLADLTDAAYSGLVAVPMHNDHKIVDLTDDIRRAIEANKPFRRKGTVAVHRPESLIDIINRFSDDDSVVFVDDGRSGAGSEPSIVAIFNYHRAGSEEYTVLGNGGKALADLKARCGDHRATYRFPVSAEFRAWREVSKSGLSQQALGEFIDAHVVDFMEPTQALMTRDKAHLNGAEWEAQLFDLAQSLGARFGAYRDLKALALSFEVDETAILKVKRNPQTGEATFQSETQHNTPSGQPVQIPGLFLAAIPVFTGGPLYRVPVAFRYRKAGDKITFFLSIYNLDDVFSRAIDSVVQAVKDGIRSEDGVVPQIIWGSAPQA